MLTINHKQDTQKFPTFSRSNLESDISLESGFRADGTWVAPIQMALCLENKLLLISINFTPKTSHA